jgi:cytochrome c-type biogenesis protein CcmE
MMATAVGRGICVGIKIKLTLAIGIILAVMISLVAVGMSQANTFYWTVDEIVQQKEQAVGKAVKLSGLIVGDSIEWNQEKMELSFQLRSEAGSLLPVRYQGMKPDTMHDGWEAIVEGRLNSQGVFEAEQLYVKCPSKYEALEEAGVANPHEEQGLPMGER